MRGYLRTFTLFLVFTGLLAGVGYIVGMTTGGDPTAMMIGFLVFALLLNLVSYFFSAKMVLASYRAKVVTPEQAPRLHRIIDRVVLRAGIPKPTVAIIPSKTPNAFATGRNPKHAVVAATEGIMELLEDDELEGVIAHEVSHVQNRDILIMTIASAIASAISWIGFMLLFSRDRNGNPLLALLVFLLAPIAATLIQLAISRSREYGADSSGAHLIGNGEPLARALEKLEHGVRARPMQQGNPSTSSLFIVNPFRGMSFASMFSTHPPTKERARRLREQVF